MSKFEVGEVAIYWGPGKWYHNMEVTIISELTIGTCYNPDTKRRELSAYHRIDSPLFPILHRLQEPCATLDELRKRRPPDWKRLCKLKDLPLMRARELA